ncbi:hypothetical protein [Mycolicibacterium sp. HS_4_1]
MTDPRAQALGTQNQDASGRDDAPSPEEPEPAPGHVFWPTSEFDARTKRRSFVTDLASGNRR